MTLLTLLKLHVRIGHVGLKLLFYSFAFIIKKSWAVVEE